MRKIKGIGKGCRLAAAIVLLSGLTACANPLTGIVRVALGGLSEEEADTDGDNIEIREWEVRKIEPDSQLNQNSSEETEKSD